MLSSPSLAIKLYGTDEPVVPMQLLTAGPLTAQFDQGALRFIKINGVEVIRNIAFVARDKDWGTYNPVISNLAIEQSDTGFKLVFDAVCKDENQEFHYSASIVGKPNGHLSFSGIGTAVTDFNTNRTGFVVLHPVAGVSGFPVEVEHVDGSVTQSEFPELIDPVQPFKDIRTLTHDASPGVKVECRMEGDTFEMEDHRQWNDASYKTYVRPIALPWPYLIPAKTAIEQRVTVTTTIASTKTTLAENTGLSSCLINVSRMGVGSMPAIGLGLEPQHTEAALEHTGLLQRLAPQLLVCWHDLRANHGVEELKQAGALAESVGAELVLEAVIPCNDFTQEIQSLAEQVAAAGVSFSAISVSPAEYLNSIMPGINWPDVPSLTDIYAATRAAFPGKTIGGGMFAFFPELNRHRPRTNGLDYITHTSNTITHACDDITVTENLEAIPYIIKTCRSFADGKPYRVGPSAIGMRFNPYGSRTMDNPDNKRVAMARMEPRQRGLINAAWCIGYAAHMARGDIDVLTLQAPVGEFGLISHKMPWQQPWFDDVATEVYPAYHAVAGLAAAAGKERLMATSSVSHDVECVAYREGLQSILWVANLTAKPQILELIGLPEEQRQIAILDADTFEDCTTSVNGLHTKNISGNLNELTLGAYAVACLTCS